ncbi:MAG: hypothetical protein ACRCXA_00090 [Peptostreptococcaceae bacterium]
MMYEMFNDINKKYLKEVEVLVKQKVSINSKNLNIIEITEKYFNETSKWMPPELVLLLTDWFLEEILKSKDVDKSSKTEYPILSHHQIKRRARKYVSVTDDVLDYLHHPKSEKSRSENKN